MNQHELYLFIVKKHYDYDGKQHPSSGVLSSVQFVVDMLNAQGLRALMVTAEDGSFQFIIRISRGSCEVV